MTWSRTLIVGFTLTVIGLAVTSPARAADAKGKKTYATPAWNRKLPCDSAAKCPRFSVLADWNGAAVLDLETGLVWERSPDTTKYPFSGPAFTLTAAVHCAQVTTGNRRGWRLPSIEELASLLDPTRTSGPFLPPGHPFTNVDVNRVLSATTSNSSPGSPWFVSLSGGGVGDGGNPQEPDTAWCVRGGSGVPVE